jgi:UDP-GlcNAc:undecaprenyl-phosphate GlcNAc-1-phosphate transferase
MSRISLFYVFLCALTSSLILTPLVSNLAVRIGGMDKPDARKIHCADTPRLGGIAIFCAFLFTVLFFTDIDRQIKAFLAGGVVIFLTGMADDLTGLKPWHKLSGQVLAASLGVITGGIKLASIGNLLGQGEIRLGYLAVPFTIFAVVGVMNAINLMDGLDGLAGGISAIACLAFGILAWDSNNFTLVIVIVALLGATVGFLHYNTYPAKIFMGDSGSLFLGYCMSFFSVLLVSRPQSGISPVAPLLVLAVPILDTLVVIVRRIRERRKIFSPDMTHLHHHLMNLGFGHKLTVIFVYSLTYLLSVITIFFSSAGDYRLFGVLLLFFALIYSSLSVLRRTELLQRANTLLNNRLTRDGYPYRTLVRVIRALRTCIRYLLLLILPLPLLSHSSYPAPALLAAYLFLVAAGHLLIADGRRGAFLPQAIFYTLGAASIFMVENFSRNGEFGGCSILLISHTLFVCLFLAVGAIVFLRGRAGYLTTTPFEFLVLFIVVAIPLLPPEFTGQYFIATGAAKSLLFFIAYKLMD